MHLVFLNQYFPPDVAPTGVMLEAVVEELVRQGHEVTVICARGGYGGAEGGISDRRSQISDVESRKPEDGTHKAGMGVRVVRVGATQLGRGSALRKMIDYAGYYLGAAWKLVTLDPRPDRVVALTTPPMLAVLARVISKVRGAGHAHWVMDIYPDVMIAHGMLRENGLAARFLRALARFGFGGSRCAGVRTLGPDMDERIARYLGASRSISESMRGSREDAKTRRSEDEENDGDGAGLRVPGQDGGGTTQNAHREAGMPRRSSGGRRRETPRSWGALWSTAGAGNVPSRGRRSEKRRSGEEACSHGREAVDAEGKAEGKAASLRHRRGWKTDDLVAMYSGNMGRGHLFDEILAVAGDGPPPGVRFAFFGGGKRREEIESWMAAHPDAPVELHDYVAAEDLAAHLASADLHLASLRPEWDGCMVPSKIQGIFAAGRPVIYVGTPTSSIGQWVEESGGGWVIPPGHPAALRSALIEAGNAEERAKRGRAAEAFATSMFAREARVREVADWAGGIDT